MIKQIKENIFYYIHEGDEVVKCVDGSIQYKGGQTKCIIISGNISHAKFVSKLCGKLNINLKSIKLYFTVKCYVMRARHSSL